MSLERIQDFEECVANRWRMADWGAMNVAVGCSGGPDSVALLTATAHRRPPRSNVWAFHFNHQLRGAASDGDEKFVQGLAQQLDCKFVVARSDGTASIPMPSAAFSTKPTSGSEAEWRKQRYLFFEAAAKQLGVRYVGVAHTRDDQVETILHNLFRGTGMAGLAGMKSFRPISHESEIILARPLLDVSKAAILDYLNLQNQNYCVDLSNVQTHLTRNWIRQELLPMLISRYGEEVKDRVAASGQALAEVRDWMEELAATRSHGHFVRWLESGFQLVFEPGNKIAWPILLEVLRRGWMNSRWGLRDMSREHWMSVRGIIDQMMDQPRQTFSLTLPGRIQMVGEHWTATFSRQTELHSVLNEGSKESRS